MSRSSWLPSAGLRLIVAALLASAAALHAAPAAAQNDPFGRGLSDNTAAPSQPAAQQKPKSGPQGPPGAPELHAAPSGEDSNIPQGAEAALPTKPLEISPTVQKQIGTDSAGTERQRGRVGSVDRNYWGLWYSEKSGGYSFKTLFPLWLERNQPSLGDPNKNDRASLFGGVYYNRRSAKVADDILFPVFWNLRDTTSRTTIIGPFVNRVAPSESHDWLAPLYFLGKKQESGYTILPPLLTWTTYEKDSGLNIIGPVFCKWQGGQKCKEASATSMDAGVAPLLFFGHDAFSTYRLIPPLLAYSATNDRTESTLDIWGGVYYRKHTPDWDSLHLFPFFYNVWGEHERHTTILPLFHYGYDEKRSLLATPLFVQRYGKDGSSTHVNWLFARHRARTEIDMFTPLFWQYRDPDIGLDQKLLFPLWFRRTSPRENTNVIFPLFAQSERIGISNTTWVTPLVRYAHGLTGWDLMLHPLLYVGRDGTDEHLLVPPIYFDFKGVESRSTVVFPFFWRFDNPSRTIQLTGNVYLEKTKSPLNRTWEAHVFPLLSFGETPKGHWWKLLYGLIGYERYRDQVQVHAFWLPFGTLDPH